MREKLSIVGVLVLLWAAREVVFGVATISRELNGARSRTVSNETSCFQVQTAPDSLDPFPTSATGVRPARQTSLPHGTGAHAPVPLPNSAASRTFRPLFTGTGESSGCSQDSSDTRAAARIVR